MRPFVNIEWVERKPFKVHIDKLRTTEFQELYIQTVMEEIGNALPIDATISLNLNFENAKISGECECQIGEFAKTIQVDGSYVQDVMKELYTKIKLIIPAIRLTIERSPAHEEKVGSA